LRARSAKPGADSWTKRKWRREYRHHALGLTLLEELTKQQPVQRQAFDSLPFELFAFALADKAPRFSTAANGAF
jgi:hypothetical protein